LSPLEIPVSLRSGATLHSFLQGYFDEVLRIDYETIYTTDFIDQLAFPDDASIVEEVKRLVQLVARHDFSTLGYDVIGRIFEQLIPPDERHLLGEYYTEPDVVDLILRFCLKHENNTVFDPSCGAGTFLVRAYLQKKLMNQRLEHERIIASLWGNDIAKFPVHLATINLAINDLRCNENFPNIVQNDFFDLVPEADIFPTRRQEGKMKVKGLGGAGRLVRHPRQFDCIVGNPPYTRAEEIGEMKGGERYYREAVAEKALKNGSGSAIARLSGRSGIHSYFFVHGGKFLQEGGWFAFVVTDTWMDAGYGAGLQEYFLNNFKIVAIVESKVERWFSDADVNTCIVVLQKASSKDRERKGNTVRFVYLLKPLSHFIPQAQGTWASQVARRDAVDNLVRTILSHSSYYENEELRICPRNQGELEETGWDKEREEYVGSKWGRHIRGAAILNRILEKAASSLVRLSSVAGVCRGFTTGADPWFYVQPVQPVEHSPGSDAKSVSKGLREVRSGDGTVWAVEDEFLKQVLKSPEKYPCIRVDAAEVNDLVIRVPAGHRPLRKSGISRYIKHGETVSYRMGKERSMVPAETKTCSGRAQWYVLPEVPATRLHWQKTFDRYYRHHCTAEPMLSNQRFYQIQARREEDEIPICFSINSSFTALWLESQRAALGLGALEATVEEVESALVLDPAKLSRRDRNRISHVFERCSTERPADITALGTSECRASMDELFLELAGFADHVERKEVLGQLQAALRDMASDRFARAKSTNKKANHVSVDVGQLAWIFHASQPDTPSEADFACSLTT